MGKNCLIIFNQKALFTFLSLLIVILSLHAQSDNNEKFICSLNYSILGDGDIPVIEIDGEYCMSFHNNFSIGASLGFGITNGRFHKNLKFVRNSVNLYLSPFGNSKIYNPEIGFGFGFYYASYLKLVSSSQGYVEESSYSGGLNVILLNNFNINENHTFQFGLFLSKFINGNINPGLKIGWGFKI